MSVREAYFDSIRWIDTSDLDKVEITNIVDRFDFHELDIEACLEENQRSRIDGYEDYLFMVIYFPKFDSVSKRYLLNEFDVFLGKDFLLTFRNYDTHHVNHIFSKYSRSERFSDDSMKLSTGFILYEIIQAMLEKTFKMLGTFSREIRIIEDKVFTGASEGLIRDILIAKRNIVTLKHILKPQIPVLVNLEEKMNHLFDNKIELYFEDLEDKLGKLVQDVEKLSETIESIEDTFKTLIEMRTNSIIKVLTIFSSIMLPLTLITSFYGMNIRLPLAMYPWGIYGMMVLVFCIMVGGVLYLRRKDKI